MKPAKTATNIAPKIKNNAFNPKKPNNKIVTGRLAHGEAKRNVITEGIPAPFLYSCIDIAKIPCEQAESKNPAKTE